MKEFIITKQVSKQGSNSLIVIPKFLQSEIKPKDIVEVRIKILKSFEVSE
jgi:hypothetical protein